MLILFARDKFPLKMEHGRTERLRSAYGTPASEFLKLTLKRFSSRFSVQQIHGGNISVKSEAGKRNV